MRNIRPNYLFNRCQGCDFSSFIPSKDGLSMLERTCLVALMKITKARRIFEFGTFLGETTRLFADNLEPDNLSIKSTKGCHLDGGIGVWTLDIQDTVGIDFVSDDGRLARMSTEHKQVFVKGSMKRDYIHQIYQDSLYFRTERYAKLFDLVFVDGNHALRYFTSDTSKAFEMVSPSGVVVWHDYSNPKFPELTEFLNQRDGNVIHIEETMLAFQFFDNRSFSEGVR